MIPRKLRGANLFQAIREQLEILQQAVREGLELLPQASRRPVLLGWCLLHARGAQIALGTVLAVVLLALPPLLDALLPALYPPIESERKLLGFIPNRTSSEDPRLEARRGQFLVLASASGISLVGALLLASLPGGVSHGRRRADQLCEQANSCLTHDPHRSAVLYDSALALTLDPARVAELAQQLRRAQERARVSAKPSAQGDVIADEEMHALRGRQTMLDPVRPTGDLACASEEVGPAGRYRLVKELGRGGMGVVYQAFDTNLEREVALKELSQHFSEQSDLARRFRQEAQLLARLSHPNIVQVHDLVEDHGRLWIAMEFVTGGTLADAMERVGGTLPWREVAAYGQQIASGLDFAHQNGVIHRDIKPINILLTQDEFPVAKLTDFGLAKHVEASVHTQAGSLLGSACYMSPEQAAGEPADARSDIYSLGITLYELLCGRTPFEGDVVSVLAQHISQVAPPLAEFCEAVPEPIADLVMTMLAKSPDERVTELSAVIETLALSASTTHGANSDG
ncbi:MAG: serine/threonine protein kinase [Deltaproteobacteria bacterium]|nr:serine/threonine protein kinase [Deltaproteobacteria bacterium]